jgi:hypothetical protein
MRFGKADSSLVRRLSHRAVHEGSIANKPEESVRLLLALLCHFPDAKEELSVALIVDHMNKAIPFRQETTHLASIEDGAAMRVDETQHWE